MPAKCDEHRAGLRDKKDPLTRFMGRSLFGEFRPTSQVARKTCAHVWARIH